MQKVKFEHYANFNYLKKKNVKYREGKIQYDRGKKSFV